MELGRDVSRKEGCVIDIFDGKDVGILKDSMLGIDVDREDGILEGEIAGGNEGMYKEIKGVCL